MRRVPVISPEGKVLMPTKSSRARRWLKEGQAKIYPNDLNLFAIQLIDEPSGYETQKIAHAGSPNHPSLLVAVTGGAGNGTRTRDP